MSKLQVLWGRDCHFTLIIQHLALPGSASDAGVQELLHHEYRSARYIGPHLRHLRIFFRKYAVVLDQS